MRFDRRVAAACILFGAALAGPALTAHAFPTGTQFDGDPLTGAGGGGIHFTASPAFPAATCATCHTDGPSRLAVRLLASDPSIFSTGYQPGRIYELQVLLDGESRGDEYNGPARCGSIAQKGFSPCNANGFALEADSPIGQVVGSLCPSEFGADGSCVRARGAPTVLAADGSAIHSAGYLESDPASKLPAGFENGAIAWRFYWRAPAAGAGAVSFHIGGVDGNGGEGTEAVPEDSAGDDTVEAHLTVEETGGQAYAATGGCTVARSGRGRLIGITPLAILLVAMTVRRRRKR